MTTDRPRALVHLFGGETPICRTTFNLESLQWVLEKAGVRYFTSHELCRVRRPSHAKPPENSDDGALIWRDGVPYFLPRKDWWMRGVALCKLLDPIRKAIGSPISVANWWRPEPYNSLVGGSEDSDHITAHAFDVDAKGEDDAADIVEYLYDGFRFDSISGALNMSIGTYEKSPRRIHVGLFSPRGHRRWHI